MVWYENMDIWDILGIKKTADIREIKKAYARKTRIYHPETHPDEFQVLHRAYEAALNYAGNTKKTVQDLTENVDFIFPKQEYGTEKMFVPNLEFDDFINEIEANSNQPRADLSGAPVKEFEDLLHDKRKSFYPKFWKNYFTDSKFLNYQYNQDFIDKITEILEKDLRSASPYEYGSIPQYAFIYLIIVYGCMFEKVSLNYIVTENVYKSESLVEMKEVLKLTENFYSKYLLIETREDLLGERYAFYIYRCILSELEEDKPNAAKIKSLLMDGFHKDNESHMLELMYVEYDGQYNSEHKKYNRKKLRLPRDPVFFDLMEYLVNKKNTPRILIDLLKEVCQMDLDIGECRETDRLKMLLEEK